MTIYEKLKELGYITVAPEFYRKVEEWKSWYVGNVKGFHTYKVKTGKRSVNCKRYSLTMGKKVPEDWANLLFNEKVKITLEGKAEQDFVNEVLLENNFAVKGNEMQELKCALGTVAYLPRVVGAMENGPAERIVLDYVTVENIFPMSWRNGMIDECAFVSKITDNGRDFVYMQLHRKNPDGLYAIENLAFHFHNGDVGSEVRLTEVKGLERVPPLVRTGSDQRQFVIDKPNSVNNFDHTNPLGISVYANAIDALENCDITFDTMVKDMITGKRRLFASPVAHTYLNGEPVFDDNDITFYALPEDTTGENKPIQAIGGDFAVEPLKMAVQTALDILSAKCGLGGSRFKFERGTAKTATEVISEHDELFQTKKRHEIILESVLIELCRIILRLGNSAMNKGLNEDVEISIDFDDSIIEDTRTDNQDMRADVAAGLIRPELYIAKKYGVTEEDALKMMPKMEDMTDDEQDEVE